MTTDIISVRQREKWWLDTFNAALGGTYAGMLSTNPMDPQDRADIATAQAELTANMVHGIQNDELTEL